MGESKPKLHGGLTSQEVMGLSLDYYADPEGCEEVVRFCRQHVDEIESFTAQLKSWSTSHSEATRLQTTYQLKMLDKWPKPDEVQTVALRAAGRLVHDTDNKHRELTADLQETGETLSLMLAQHLTDRLGDKKSVRINGRTYDFHDGILTTPFREEGSTKKRMTVFGRLPHMQRLAVKYYSPKLKDKDKNIVPKIASAEDWHMLVDDLVLASKY